MDLEKCPPVHMTQITEVLCDREKWRTLQHAHRTRKEYKTHMLVHLQRCSLHLSVGSMAKVAQQRVGEEGVEAY